MFENLSEREKKLALAVVCLLPMLLLFFGWWSFNSRYISGKTSLTSLDNQIKAEKQKSLDAMSAGVRRSFYYTNHSFPTNKKNITRYQDWLEKSIRDNGLDFKTIDKPKQSKLTFRGEDGQGLSTVADKFDFNFDATGTLDQILKFVYEFEQVDLLHKIKTLTITPLDSSEGPVRCKAALKVEVLSLVEAEASRDFLERTRELPRKLDSYMDVVLSRNIFGPANTAPTLKIGRKTFREDDEISFLLSGRDSDKSDTLSYELLDAGGIEGAKIEVSSKGKATFESSKLDIGEYEIKVAVSDNGLPSKTTEAIGKIVVNEKRKPREDPPEEPPRKNIGETAITRVAKNKDAVETVKIKVRTTGEVFVLGIGEDFELDGKTWTVRELDTVKATVTLATDGKLLEFRPGNFLNKPRKESVDTSFEAEASGS